MTIDDGFLTFSSDPQSRQFGIGGPRLVFICLVLLAPLNLAKAQTAVDYRFLEVLDSSGNPVANAEVETNTSRGSREKTDEKGLVKVAIYSGDYHTTSLKVSKADYYPYEDPAPPFSYHCNYFLIDEIPAVDLRAPLRIELLKIPTGAANNDALENKQRERELILAAKKGDGATVQALLQAGVDAGAKDAYGIPAIRWATFSGDADAITALLAAGERAGPNALRYYLFYASKIDRDTVSSLLREVQNINAADHEGQTLLILAAASRSPQSADAVEILMQHRLAIDAKDREGRTALIAAVETGTNSIEKVKLLLVARPDLNSVDRRKRSALTLAASYGSPETVKMLIDAGSDINIRDDLGQTPLIAALDRGFISDPDSTAARVKLLLAAGADVTVQNDEGQTALDLAKKSGNEKLIKLLEGFPQ